MQVDLCLSSYTCVAKFSSRLFALPVQQSGGWDLRGVNIWGMRTVRSSPETTMRLLQVRCERPSLPPSPPPSLSQSFQHSCLTPDRQTLIISTSTCPRSRTIQTLTRGHREQQRSTEECVECRDVVRDDVVSAHTQRRHAASQTTRFNQAGTNCSYEGKSFIKMIHKNKKILKYFLMGGLRKSNHSDNDCDECDDISFLVLIDSLFYICLQKLDTKQSEMF